VSAADSSTVSAGNAVERTLFQLPSLFELPKEWSELKAAIDDLDQTSALSSILGTMRHQATLAMIEHEYIDQDFRDEYVNHYATTYRPLPNRCRRLHFFATEDSGDRYLGYCVLRPVRAHPTCRTVISPPEGLLPYISCLCTSTVRPYGQRLRVTGFPFMEQDSQFGVCAHASVWMVALYHNLTNHTPRRVVSDVALGAALHPERFRVTPSGGLSETQVAVALDRLGLGPIYYSVVGLSDEDISTIVCRYLNSHLPVVLITHGHATVLIGYGRDRDGGLFYIRSDEGRGPYDVIDATDDPLGAWHFLFVPTPGRIYLKGEAAEAVARQIFEGLLRQDDLKALHRRLRGGLRLRSYVTQAGDYKVRAPERGVTPAIYSTQRFVGTSNWIWVVELQDPILAPHSRCCVLGEIAIDATCDPFDSNPLFGYLAGGSYIWHDGRKLPIRGDGQNTTPHLSATAIHDAPSPWLARAPLGTRPQ
jgi:hypothetical protein